MIFLTLTQLMTYSTVQVDGWKGTENRRLTLVRAENKEWGLDEPCERKKGDLLVVPGRVGTVRLKTTSDTQKSGTFTDTVTLK